MATRCLVAVAFIGATLGASGCMGSGGGDSVPASSSVDSAESYSGAKREVAEVIERYEAAAVAGDVTALCRDTLGVEENRGYDNDNGGREFCEMDPANQPSRVTSAAGGAERFDLVVESIKRAAKEPGRDRFTALVSADGEQEAFVVRRLSRTWAITARDLSPMDELKGEKRDSPCERGAVTVRSSLVPRNRDPRQAVIQGPFGSRIEKVLDKGGSLELDYVTYRPDYLLSYVLRTKSGDYNASFPVRVWGPRSYDVYSMAFCRDGQQAGIII